jgi:hypothetical protein
MDSQPQAPAVDTDWPALALEHCRVLCKEIGPRPSTGAGEKQAADYALQVLLRAWEPVLAGDAHAAPPRRELILSQRSAYRPYSLALAAGLAAHLFSGRSWMKRVAGAGLSAAAAWAFSREADLKTNWTHKILKPGDSQNIVAVLPARGDSKGERRRRIVLCAHLDSHRTPIFYSHPLWLKIFAPFIALTFASLAVDAVRHAAGSSRRSKLGKLHAMIEAVALLLTLQAEKSPYSHGANDNASGAGVVLSLAQRLANEPLHNCEVWIVLTGCEEVGAHGMRALLRRHEKALRDAPFLNFDMVGVGAPTVNAAEGLLLKVPCDLHLRAVAFQVAQDNPDLLGGEHAGAAYTDATFARQNGLAALTIDSQTPQSHVAHARGGYWHQREDTFDKIEPECLAAAHELGWKMLQKLDGEAASL